MNQIVQTLRNNNKPLQFSHRWFGCRQRSTDDLEHFRLTHGYLNNIIIYDSARGNVQKSAFVAMAREYLNLN